METEAGQYAEGFGMQENAAMGRGREYNDNLLTSAFKRISSTGVSQNAQLGSKFINSGMQFSGAAQSKAPMSVASSMFAQGLDARNKVSESDEQYKLDQASKWVDILKHEDNYSLQQQQIEAAEGDWLDTAGKIGSLISMFV